MSLDPAAAFKAANLLAVTGWLLLVVALLRKRPSPRWAKWALPAIFATAYLAVVASQIGSSGVDFGSLAGVQALFAQPWWVVAGWLHYLAFDLWVGSWQVDETRRLALPRAAVAICLLLTFGFGPVGWLAFALLRWRAARLAA